MTLAAASIAPARTGVGTPAGVVWRVEVAKLRAQARVRIALAACLLAPLAFGGLLHFTESVPADTVFGRWVHETTEGIPLVVLGFAGSWALPAVVALVSGDLFSAEDHHGTWKTILTRSAGRGAIFTGKALAAAAYAVVAVAVLALSALVSGLLLGGHRRLPNLSGVDLATGHGSVLVLAAWASVLPAVLAFGAVGLLVSVASHNSLAGIATAVALGLLTQLLSLVDGAQWLVALLPGRSFLGWHGLFATPAFVGPLLQGVLVGTVWTGVCTAAAWIVFVRRDITTG